MALDYAAGALLYKKFTTRDANVPATLSGSPVVKVYKDDSTSTEENTGVTLSVDFDGVTGFNHITIDTSADATFYANGHHYAVVITTGTVGGSSVVGETVWEFDLVAAVASAPTAAQNATAVWQDATAGDFTVSSSIGKSLFTSGAAPGAAGGLFIAGTNAATTITTALTTHIVGTVDTVTTYTGNTPQTGDAYARLGAPAGASVSADIAAIKSDTGTILTDVNTGAGAIYTRLGSPSGASIAADIASVKSSVGSVTGNVGGNVTGTIGGFTAAALAQFFTLNTTKVYTDAISGSVVKEVASNASGGGTAPSAATVAAAVWDEVLTGATHNITNSAGKLLRSVAPNSSAIYSGTLPSQVGMTSRQIKLDSGASSSDNVYNNDVVSILANTGAGESAIILGYVGSTRVATLDRDWVVQPTATATFEITPLTTVTVTGPVTVGTMNAGVITTGSIASGALNGKGDWLTSLGATAPDGWITDTAIASGALNGKGDWSTLTAAGVWVNSVRTLTAGTNIVLTKGIGVTGFTDLDAAGIRAAVGMDIADLDAQLELLPTAAEAADKFLGRNIAGGADGGRTVAEAMAFLRNKWVISGGTLIVYATNDSTTLWTATVTTTSGNPVTAIDPA